MFPVIGEPKRAMSRIPFTCLLASLLLVAAMPAVGAIAGAPDSGQAAVFFDPRSTPSQMMTYAARSGASVVRFGAAPGSLVVDLPDAEAGHALRAAGAWIIADPVVLGGCSASRPLNMEPRL